MGHKKSSVSVLERSTYWGDGIARIAILRRDTINDVKRKADRALGRAEMALDAAQDRFNDATVHFGKVSGHANYQRADSALTKAHRDHREVKRRLKRLDTQLETIDSEQSMLDTLVREFLQGNVPRSECGSMRLIVSPDGNLNIHFSRGAEILTGGELTYDGHFIVRPDGRMQSMYLRR